MQTPTVSEPEKWPAVVDDLNVGARLRDLRTAAHLTLRQVAERAEISEGFLSQVERGASSASIATIRRIASTLGLDIAGLFSRTWPPAPHVVKREDRPYLQIPGLGRKYLLSPVPRRYLEVFQGEFEPNGSTGDEAYSHGNSEEILLVIAGKVRLTLDSAVHELEEGDSICYSSSLPHKLEEIEGSPAQVVWIISPPTY
jgi:transcriptional regulator with XRE-family HTH domain